MSCQTDPVMCPRRRLPRVPKFYPVPLRPHKHAFTPRLQAHFLGFLAESGSVAFACERVGKSRQSAYRLRTKPGAESFCAAWDAALGSPVRRVTVADLEYLAYHGWIRPMFRAGRYRGFRQTPCATALLRLVGRYDRLLDGAEARALAKSDTPAQIRTELCVTKGDRLTPCRTGSSSFSS